MGRLVEEVKEWNTPLVGAYLLWNFTKSYVHAQVQNEAPVVILHFIAHPLLTSNEYSDTINNYRPNLASYVRGFTDKHKTDLLACFNERVYKQIKITMEAIDIAVASGLLVWNTDKATLWPLKDLKQARGNAHRGIDIKTKSKKAEILGRWFANIDINTITSYLGVIL